MRPVEGYGYDDGGGGGSRIDLELFAGHCGTRGAATEIACFLLFVYLSILLVVSSFTMRPFASPLAKSNMASML